MCPPESQRLNGGRALSGRHRARRAGEGTRQRHELGCLVLPWQPFTLRNIYLAGLSEPIEPRVALGV